MSIWHKVQRPQTKNTPEGGAVLSGSEKLPFCRADIILIILLAVIGIVLSGYIFLSPKGEGETLEIRQNGKTIMTLPLANDTQKTITGPNGGSNTFYIKNGTITMNSADCGDKTCIRTGTISKAGESIVCLPHRLVLTITSGDADAESTIPDAIVK